MRTPRDLGESLLLVGGCPRSGTTLLQNILDSHPDIVGGPEFDHLPRIVELRELLLDGHTSGRLAAYNLDVDAAVSGFVADLLEPYRTSHGARLLSEKTPENALHFAPLLEVFPRARAIFVVRDPRAVAASMLEVGSRANRQATHTPPFTHGVLQAIDTISEYNNAGLSLVGHERYRVVRYESLVEFPEQETRNLCEFLGLVWSSEMLRPASASHDGEGVLDDVWYTKAMYRSDPDPTRAHTWRDQLGRRRRLLVEAAFRSDPRLTADLGYELGSPTPLQRLLRVDAWLLPVIRKIAYLGRMVRKARSALGRIASKR